MAPLIVQVLKECVEGPSSVAAIELCGGVTGWESFYVYLFQSVRICYKETPRGPANPMQAPGPNPCPALVTQGATNLPQVSPTTCSTQAELASHMSVRVHMCKNIHAGLLRPIGLTAGLSCIRGYAFVTWLVEREVLGPRPKQGRPMGHGPATANAGGYG